MIKFDSTYSDYVETQDPAYPGGKAVNATTTESTDGTPLLADWMNDVNGARQALFLEAFGDINKVSGRPDNAQESDVLKAIKQLLWATAFQFRGRVPKTDVDKTVVSGFYRVDSQGCAGRLLVFSTNGSTGVVQFYKDGCKNEPWMCRNAVNSDVYRWTEWSFLGVQLTTNMPNSEECQRDNPWAASPHWVYNLLTGNAAEDVNNAVAAAIRKLVSGGVKHIDFSNETGFIEWDNGFKIESVSFSIDKSWGHIESRVFYFPIAFQTKPIFISCSVRGGAFSSAVGVALELRSLDTTKFSVGVYDAESGLYEKGCLLVMGV